MAEKIPMTVRLAPSYQHLLGWVAKRQGAAPAELARVIVQRELDAILRERTWRPQWQDAYNAWLNAQQTAQAAAAETAKVSA